MSRRPTAASPPDVPVKVRKLRCAVYTRKSTDEGLEKEFNSLDAQREFLRGIHCLPAIGRLGAGPDCYDDGGGVSGGTLDRPALRRLLGDIETGSGPLCRRLSTRSTVCLGR